MNRVLAIDVALKTINNLTTFRNGFVLELLICGIIFSFGSKPRRFWKIPPIITVVLCAAAFYFVGRFFPKIPVPTLTGLTTFILLVLFAWLALDEPFNRVLFNCAGAYAVQNLAINVREVFQYIVRLDGWPKSIVRMAITIAVYVACYFVFARKREKEDLNVSSISLYLVTLITIVIADVLTVVVATTGQSSAVVKVVLGICCLGALVWQYNIFNHGVMLKEAAIMEQLLYQEQRYHEMTQETIDLINIKCHDLKRQIELFRKTYGGEAEGMIKEVENAVMLYGDLANTGNKNLDLVITEYKLVCEKHGVKIDIMADGKLIDFMSAYDVYSFFGNALNNAIECVIDEPEGKRNITLDIHEKGEYTCVRIENYCSHKVEFKNGLPLTHKEDKHIHGYGVKSMEYIAKKYGGNMVVDLKDETFKIKALFKKQ